MPFELYSIFVIEEKFGFNKTTLKLYFIDQLKSILISIVLGVPILSALLHVIKWGGSSFWLYAWGFFALVVLFLQAIYPNFIASLFNTYKPLEQNELRNDIDALIQKIKFPSDKVFVVDASKRSTHGNAYYYGFFKMKRIVIYDTLLQQVDKQGVVAILGHELGHYFLSHNLWNMMIIQMYMLLFFYLFAQMINSPDLYTAFGFRSQPVFIGLTLFSFVYGPLEHLFSFLMNVLCRRFEYQADAFAIKHELSLQGPLIKIHVDNLGTLCPDPWYSTYHYNHPTLVERLRAMDALQKKKE